MLGISLKIISVVLFLAMSALIKAASEVPVGEIVFFRSLFALVPIFIYLGYKGQIKSAFITKRPLGHFMRGLIGATSMAMGFYAITVLPLPESTTINYATPLILVIFSAVFLHEHVRAYRWTAVIIGLIGVIIIMWPNLTVFTSGNAVMGPATIGAIVAFAACFLTAFAMMTVRNLTRTEPSATIVIYFSLSCTLLALLSFPFGWIVPSFQSTLLLIVAGIFGGVAQIAMTESYRHAEVSTLAPFDYSSMILSIIIGYFFFEEVPTVEVIIGGSVVVMAGLFIIYRERELGIARKKEKKASLPL